MKKKEELACMLLIILLSSCNFLGPQMNKAKFKCSESEIITFLPPEGTYRCQINLIVSCSNTDTIIIYSDGRLQKSMVFSTENNGVLMDGDWYIGELGIQYQSKLDSLNKNKGSDVILEVLFYSNLID